MVTCLPTCISDRLNSSDVKLCWWDPVQNRIFGYYIAVVGQHLPCTIIIFCYVRVFVLMKRQFKLRPGAQHQAVTVQVRPGPSTSTSSSQTANTTTTRVSVAVSASTPTESSKPSRECKDQHNKTVKEAKAVDVAEERASQERKLFTTMSCVVITFMICWVPFHVVHDLSIVAPSLVSPNLFLATFWMTYLNSALNPLVYAFSNREIRAVTLRVIKCKI